MVCLPLALDPDNPDPRGVYAAWDEAEEAQDEVDPEVDAEALGEPDGDWWEEEAEDEADDLRDRVFAHGCGRLCELSRRKGGVVSGGLFVRVKEGKQPEWKVGRHARGMRRVNAGRADVTHLHGTVSTWEFNSHICANHSARNKPVVSEAFWIPRPRSM